MGCDIHLVLEKKDGSRWVAINTFTSHAAAYRKKGDRTTIPVARSRNYARFALLAGVRGDGPEPKRLPLDASETTAFLGREWGSDGHSHSFMPIREAVEIFAATERWREDDTLETFDRKYPVYFFFGVEPKDEADLENYRIVFWFDN